MFQLLILTTFLVLTPVASNFKMNHSYNMRTEFLCSAVGLSCPQDTHCCINSNGGLDCCPSTQLLNEAQAVKKKICPDGHSVCLDGQTCCLLSDGRSYGCCPFRHAVCCHDHHHCCPSGNTCDDAHHNCIKTNTDVLRFIGYI